MDKVRLNKYLASLGIASRRHIDELIEKNKVIVNGRKAVLGQKIDPLSDQVEVNGRNINHKKPNYIYIALNKPTGVISSTTDTHNRQTVLDLIDSDARLYPIGRLDYDSSGLILLTNDGDLSLKATHPRYHLPKTYLVTVEGRISPEKIFKLRHGVELEDGVTLPTQTSVISQKNGRTNLKIQLREGRNRQIRRMVAKLNLRIISLHRIAIGPIKLGELKAKEYRYLTSSELALLKNFFTAKSPKR